VKATTRGGVRNGGSGGGGAGKWGKEEEYPLFGGKSPLSHRQCWPAKYLPSAGAPACPPMG
jgi:hypothetical protein